MAFIDCLITVHHRFRKLDILYYLYTGLRSGTTDGSLTMFHCCSLLRLLLLVLWFIVVGLNCDIRAPYVRCGHSGIQEAQCRSRNCCWISISSSLNFCFKPASRPTTGESHVTITDTTITVNSVSGVQLYNYKHSRHLDVT